MENDSVSRVYCAHHRHATCTSFTHDRLYDHVYVGQCSYVVAAVGSR